jgi:hypothetical protein
MNQAIMEISYKIKKWISESYNYATIVDLNVEEPLFV